MSVKTPDQGIVFQLYMNKDRSASEKLIRSLESRGFKAIMLTVDAAVAGKRELDQRAKGDVGSAVRFGTSYHGGSSLNSAGPCTERLGDNRTGSRTCSTSPGMATILC
jgi:hypothetical protein